MNRTARHTRRARGLAALPASQIPAVAAILAGPAAPAVEFPTRPLFLPGLRPAVTTGAVR